MFGSNCRSHAFDEIHNKRVHLGVFFEDDFSTTNGRVEIKCSIVTEAKLLDNVVAMARVLEGLDLVKIACVCGHKHKSRELVFGGGIAVLVKRRFGRVVGFLVLFVVHEGGSDGEAEVEVRLVGKVAAIGFKKACHVGRGCLVHTHFGELGDDNTGHVGMVRHGVDGCGSIFLIVFGYLSKCLSMIGLQHGRTRG